MIETAMEFEEYFFALKEIADAGHKATLLVKQYELENGRITPMGETYIKYLYEHQDEHFLSYDRNKNKRTDLSDSHQLERGNIRPILRDS